MRMDELLKAKFFGPLSDTSKEVSNEEIQNAYGEFIEQIRTVSNGNDYSTTYRILVATRIEIASSVSTRSNGISSLSNVV